MAFFGVALAVICRMEAVADLMCILSDIKNTISNNGVSKTNSEKHMLDTAVRRPLCNSLLNILIVGIVRLIIL